MTAPKHTPGPWKFTPCRRFLRQWCTGHDLYLGAVNVGKQAIAIVARDGLDSMEAEHNLRLIAAAPELLAVAIKGGSLISGDLVGVEWKRACADFAKEARAAIAKATGATP